MKLVTRIAAAALVGLTIGAIDAAAQNAPGTPPVPPQRQTLAPLTADQVKTVIAGRLVMMRSDLKVGKVTEKDANTYDVELLKADNSVAEHALVDKITARPAGALERHHFGMMGGYGMGGHFRHHGDCPMGLNDSGTASPSPSR